MDGKLENKAENADRLAGGTLETKEYYDKHGWTKLPDGRLTDNVRFGKPEGCPLRIASHQLHMRRIHEALDQAGESLNLLECGCGGNPELSLLDLCAHYTGIDFSPNGLKAADEKLKSQGIPYLLVEADVCSIPFADGSFDAVYSANMVFHIQDPEGQAAAFREMLRVTKNDGIVVLILDNPRPLLFPGCLVRQLIADTPIVGHMLYKLLYKLRNKLRRKTSAPIIPYNPRPLGWMRRRLQPFGKVEIIGSRMASGWFSRHISEKQILGRLAWKALVWLEREHPKACALLGNKIQITVRKTS